MAADPSPYRSSCSARCSSRLGCAATPPTRSWPGRSAAGGERGLERAGLAGSGAAWCSSLSVSSRRRLGGRRPRRELRSRLVTFSARITWGGNAVSASKRWLVGGVGLLMGFAVACGGSGGEKVSLDATPVALRHAAATTVDKGTSKIEFTIGMSVQGHDVTLKGTGAFDTANKRVQETIDTKDLFSQMA